MKFRTSEIYLLTITKTTKKSLLVQNPENKAYLKNKSIMIRLKDKEMTLKAFLTRKSTTHVSSQILFFQKTRARVNQINYRANSNTRQNKMVWKFLHPKI